MHAKEIRKTPFYRRFPPAVPVMMLETRCCISHKPPFIYFRIPKAANTTVMATIYEADRGTFDVGETALNEYKESFVRPSSLTAQQVTSLLDTHITFSIFRNPYSRLVSAYLDKIAGNKAEKRKVANALGRTPSDRVTFDEFLAYLETGGLRGDAHWAPQVDLVPIGVKALHHHGYVESISEDVQRIISAIFSSPVEMRRFSPRPTNAREKVREFLEGPQRRRVHALYEEDFDRLGYPASLDCP